MSSGATPSVTLAASRPRLARGAEGVFAISYAGAGICSRHNRPPIGGLNAIARPHLSLLAARGAAYVRDIDALVRGASGCDRGVDRAQGCEPDDAAVCAFTG